MIGPMIIDYSNVKHKEEIIMKKVNRLTFERFISKHRSNIQVSVTILNDPVTTLFLHGRPVAKKVYRTPTAIPFRMVTSYYIEETDANNH